MIFNAACGGQTRTRGLLGPAFVLLTLTLGLGSAGLRAQTVPTPVGTQISNTAQASFSRVVGVTETRASNTVTTTVNASAGLSEIELLRVVASPSAAAKAIVAGPVTCRSTASAAAVSAAKAVPQSAATLVNVVKTTVFRDGEPIYIRVTDDDQNLDPNALDTVTVTLTSAATGDLEKVLLTETGINTGVFAGSIRTEIAATVAGDCMLQVTRASRVDATYDDDFDNDSSSASALVDPQGLVFNAQTGAPVSGVRLSLLDALTGLPAVVYGDDGVSAYPSQVVTGEVVSDAGGNLYTYPAGGYRFPLVDHTGRYRLLVQAPAGYNFPSQADPATLPALPGGPYTLAEGSFGREYAVDLVAAAAVDVPLDPVGGPLIVTKTAAQATVAIGDALGYTVTLRNSGAEIAHAATVVDRLPEGFRYVAGSAHLGDGVGRVLLADPAIDAHGQTLSFLVGDVPVAATQTLHYVVRLGANVRTGPATNRATALVSGLSSNTAEASVQVTSDLFRDRGFILGRVVAGSCEAAVKGVAGVRVYLEDGRTAVSDRDGRFHLEDLRGGAHVVQLDRTTLPRGATIVDCAALASRGDGSARLLELRAGGLARADFVLSLPAAVVPASGAVAAPSAAPVAQGENILLEQLPRLDTLSAGRALLLPSEGFSPAIPAMHIAVKHAPGDTLAITLNGAPVPPVTRDHTLYNAERTFAVSRWRGVSLVEGDNQVVIELRDAQGRQVASFERRIRYAGPAVRAEVDAAHSLLVADGRTHPIVALRLYDRSGHLARPGMQGTYRLEAPYRAWSEIEALKDNPLLAQQPRDNVYQVGADGVARVELEPTSSAGTAVLRLRFGERQEQELRAWLEPAARDFILVGLAAGTTGYRALSEHATPLPAGAPAEGFERDGRVAFFAKGQVLGSYLLTLAYDSERSRAPLDTKLQGVIDPHRYYTLYGDGSEMRDDAPSTRKLYVKLERRQFVALFGDFDTGLTVTELARYSRKLNGVRIEAASDHVRGIAFAARTAEQAGRDVLGGDGTSGPYRLSAHGLVPGGDTVRLEVRDRFRSEIVVSSTPLARYLDYDIDYVAGTLFFNHPVASRDEAGNPVYVVAEYEISGNGGEHLTAGARASFRALHGRLEGGVTLLSEGASGGDRKLGGVDLRAHLSEVTQLRAEAASSRSDDPTRPAQGGAYLLELSTTGERLEGRAYLREQAAGFGLGQQALTETATRKLGIEGRDKIADHWSLKGQAYQQRALDRDAERSLGEAEAHYESGPRIVGLGLRSVVDARDGVEARSEQIYANLARDVLGGRVVLKAASELSLAGHNGSAEYPDRIRVGADYRVSRSYTLFSSYEHSHGAQGSSELARVGIKAEPWSGGQVETALNQSSGENGTRLYSNLGLAQGWRASERLSLDVGIERASTLQGSAAAPITGPLFSTAPANDFTAGFLGATYRATGWTWVSRLERRTGIAESRSIGSLGGYRDSRAGQAFSLALHYIAATTVTGRSLSEDMRLSWAYRPDGSRLIGLDRLEFIRDEQTGVRSLRAVNNAHLNLELDHATQIGLQLGLRVGRQTLFDNQYTGTSVLIGADLRRDLNARWDVGAQLTSFDSLATHTRQFSAGIDVGRRFGRQLWVSVGWNAAGFSDRDFSRERYTAQGAYLRFRVHLDDGSLRELLDGFRAGNRR